MKRLLALSVVLLVVSFFCVTTALSETAQAEAGTEAELEFLTFGSYQGEAIEWRVLDVDEDGRMLLLSQKILDTQPFDTEHEDIPWENCTLRAWLNNDFYNAAFTAAEQSRIQETQVMTGDNIWAQPDRGNDTRDRIFLLSVSEIRKYFPEIGTAEVTDDVLAFPTKYAIAEGVLVRGKGKGDNSTVDWWLRSPGGNRIRALLIGYDSFFHINSPANSKNYGVRPVLWLNTSIPHSADQHITAFHVMENAIYYGVVVNATGQGAIVRADLDGSNPTVLADGFETGRGKLANGYNYTGKLERILVAGGWMTFAEENGGTRTWYLMRLDGTDLHKLGEPFLPEDAPGITDSTGKWRYELLADGSAMILGPGSKLKHTGKLAIPAAVDKIPVTAIGANAFYGGEGFTSVTIPKSVTSIGDFAFFWCRGLTEITVPEGVTSIGEGAFQWCSKVKKVSLPASLASVGQQAFADCPSVKLSVAKKNEVFEIADGVLFDRVQNKPVD